MLGRGKSLRIGSGWTSSGRCTVWKALVGYGGSDKIACFPGYAKPLLARAGAAESGCGTLCDDDGLFCPSEPPPTSGRYTRWSCEFCGGTSFCPLNAGIPYVKIKNKPSNASSCPIHE